MTYDVHVLYDGYSKMTDEGMVANCTCTLIKGPELIIVDTMTPWDKEKIITGTVSCTGAEFHFKIKQKLMCCHIHTSFRVCAYSENLNLKWARSRKWVLHFLCPSTFTYLAKGYL